MRKILRVLVFGIFFLKVQGNTCKIVASLVSPISRIKELNELSGVEVTDKLINKRVNINGHYDRD